MTVNSDIDDDGATKHGKFHKGRAGTLEGGWVGGGGGGDEVDGRTGVREREEPESLGGSGKACVFSGTGRR